MSDPLDRPPVDHGSDRYDYVEVIAPEGVAPAGPWFARLLAEPCSDCRANVFIRWLDTRRTVLDPQAWHVQIAHDETCPWLARREAENGR